jgi:hypothetical protein
VGLVPIGQRLVHLLELLGLLLRDLVVVEDVDVLLGDALDLSLLILAKMLSGEFINGVVEDQNLVTLLGVLLQDGASKDRFF